MHTFFINAMNGVSSIRLFCNAIYSVNSAVSFHAANGINRNIYHRNTFLKLTGYYLAGPHLKMSSIVNSVL